MFLSDFENVFIGLDVVGANGVPGKVSKIEGNKILSNDGEGPVITVNWDNKRTSVFNQNMYDKVRVKNVILNETAN